MAAQGDAQAQGSAMAIEDFKAGPAGGSQEDEVDLLCTQLLRRLNQLKMRKNADIALKKIVDATVAELKSRSKEVQARCYKRQMASATYTETIAETEVAQSKVVATADAVATILNNDVASDDADDIPEVPEAESTRRGIEPPAPKEPDQDAAAKRKEKAKKRRRRAGN